jgi:aminopeptidase YwaD
MKKQFFSFLILISLVAGVAAQKAQVAKSEAVAEQNLRKHVAYLASDKLEGRRTGTQGATYAAGYAANVFAQNKLKAGFKGANGKASFLQPFAYAPRNEKGEVLPNVAPVEAYNVIGILPGTDSILKAEAVVIGAHYDHLGQGGQGSLAANSTAIHYGADDNASGVAAMLELARYFAKAKNNKRTLIFIAFGGEEEGLLGSKFYTSNPAFPLDKTVAMINLDMVGRLNEDKLTIGGIGTASEWRDLVTSLNNKAATRFIERENLQRGSYFKVQNTVSENEAKKLIDANQAVPVYGDGKLMAVMEKVSLFQLSLNEDGFGPSDHHSFYAKQIPVLFFFTGTHLDYHKPTDTAEKINYDGLLKVTNYVGEIVKSIDENPQRPTYKVAPSANTGGRASFNVTIGVIPSYAEADGGLVLDGVRDDSPAARAGIKAGDKIVKFAGREIRNIQDYTALLGELKADTEYDIEVIRGTERLTLKVKPAARK